MAAIAVETSNKGKGKVRPRKAQSGSSVPFVHRVTAVSHKDAVLGERAGDPKPRYPESFTNGNESQIPKFRTTNIVELNQALTRIRQGLPVVLQDCPLLGELKAGTSRPGLFGKWTFEYLASALERKDWPAMISAADKNRFLFANLALNVHGGQYHVREPETALMATTFADFVKSARTWSTRPLFLQGQLMLQSLQSAASNQPSPPTCPPAVGPRCAGDLAGDVAWDWLRDTLLQPCRLGGVFQVAMSCGMRGGVRPLHYVGIETLQAQLSGRRRVLLIDPVHSFQGLYPYPVAHPYDRQSMVDLDQPDYDNWPNLSQVHGEVCILERGEVLYTPMWWWRHEQQLEDETITLEFMLHQGSRVRTLNMSLLPLGRAVETRIERAGVPLREVKRWVSIVAAASEAEHIDLGTVEGHRLIQLVQELRDEVDLCLGAGSWQGFLVALADRRLEPTPWLNVDFREPLYLKDTPVQVEDTRSEAERQFPEFFHSKLTSEGYHVEKTSMSVLNPQHPNFIHKDNPNYQSRLKGGS